MIKVLNAWLHRPASTRFHYGIGVVVGAYAVWLATHESVGK